jgi:deoxyribonuclease V
MEVVRSELHPDPTLDRDEQLHIQRQVALRAQFAGGGSVLGRDQENLVVVGVDQAFDDGDVISAAVAMANGEIIERSTARRPLRMPYVPGLLCFREGEAVVAALTELEKTPDVLMCDGNGRIHPRQAGLATHLGVLFDLPTVGVAKNFLCGRRTSSLEEPFEEGRYEPILADEEILDVWSNDADWPTIGFVYQSRQFDNPERHHVNPVYVSPGHRVSARTAVDLVGRFCDGYKLPEPIRLADSAATEAKGKD